MILTLCEKRQQKLRNVFRIAILSFNIVGLFICMYIERILQLFFGNKEIVQMFRKLMGGNGFLLEEFNVVIKVAYGIMVVLLIGLCIMIYHLIGHEAAPRAKIRQLMCYIGYKNRQIFAHEYMYQMWDLLCAYGIGALIIGVVRYVMTKSEQMSELLETLRWSTQKDICIYGVVFVCLIVLNLFCCMRQKNIVQIEKE